MGNGKEKKKKKTLQVKKGNHYLPYISWILICHRNKYVSLSVHVSLSLPLLLFTPLSPS